MWTTRNRQASCNDIKPSLRDHNLISRTVPKRAFDLYSSFVEKKERLIKFMLSSSGNSISKEIAEKIFDAILEYSRLRRLDPFLITAIVWKESEFKPFAIKDTFTGLMQISYRVHRLALRNAGIET
ncbi:MAG: transglycosylase SLT domain-containing protein [Candidatus Micrarchaeota archaeon]|nr:transglycosylase SLT domain-containing protein [Candidatus Micrarchaeota archaeon]